ncbi:hypothetical protein [Spiroplasma endosymbiont of Panzeria rudis]|uniref:hypothetical protein n=1 Tax=Spiroplasma endosymbiont of Panzeria rudis TaxID=3066301 RepID=UPI0030D0D0CB
MIIYKCDYCQKSIIDGNWIRNYRKIFWFKKIKWYMHQICFIAYENEELNNDNKN